MPRYRLVSDDELLHIPRGYIYPAALREVTAQVANATLAICNPDVWGKLGTACSSDSTKFGAWDRMVLSRFSSRYLSHLRSQPFECERAFGWNSFAILAMKSDVPEALVNAISGTASARCQLRFVVGTEENNIISALRRHLDASGFPMVQMKRVEIGFFSATRLNPGHPWVAFAANSLKKPVA